MITWIDVNRYVTARKAGVHYRFEKDELPHPRTAGFSKSIGLPRGQKSDWRLGSLHAQDFGRYWSVHRDRVDPATNPVLHFAADAPEVFAGCVAAGALAFGRDPFRWGSAALGAGKLAAVASDLDHFGIADLIGI